MMGDEMRSPRSATELFPGEEAARGGTGRRNGGGVTGAGGWGQGA
jgi:hypothetical protein